jgi:hypothetical protein
MNDVENIVTSISWELTVTDGEHTVNISKVEPINYDETSEFITYTELTESKIIEWLHESMGERVSMFEAMCAINIEKKKTPKPINNLPWLM